MKWLSKYRKGYGYLVSWVSEERETGKQILGSSQIVTDHRIKFPEIDGIAAHISDEVSNELIPVVVMGLTYMGRVKKNSS